MGARGPKSARELMTVASNIIEIPRPPAPSELTEEEAIEWRAHVTRMSADYFGRETWPLLVQLCRHTVMARQIAVAIQRAMKNSDDQALVIKLLAAQERETRAINALSRALRLSHVSNARCERTHKEVPSTAPWIE
jgi:hypothetical protein